MKKFLRGFTKNRIILLCVVCALVIACLVCALTASSMASRLASQRADERFRGESDERFAQVSAFFPAGKGIDRSGVNTFRKSLEGSLTEASLEAPETGSLWMDAFSAKGSVSITSEKGTVTATALGVGGDWFAFHNLRLLSGGYISESDLMHDRIVIDEVLAWRLFGGYELEGMAVTIGGTPYIIAGVVEREDDFADAKAYNNDGLVIMHYDALDALTEESDEISCYELVCADPISGFALSLVKKGFADAQTVENSARFGLGRIWTLLRSFGERSMSDTAVVYPYWENAARLTEDYVVTLTLLAVLFALFPLVCAVIIAVRLIKRFWAWLKERLSARWAVISDRIREKQRLRIIEKQKKTYGEE